MLRRAFSEDGQIGDRGVGGWCVGNKATGSLLLLGAVVVPLMAGAEQTEEDELAVESVLGRRQRDGKVRGEISDDGVR